MIRRIASRLFVFGIAWVWVISGVRGEAAQSSATQPATGGSSTATTAPALPAPLSLEAAATQPAEETPPWPYNVRPLSLDRPTMTDDWFGLGKSMRDYGFDMKFYWLQHWFSVMDGGIKTGDKSDATFDWLMTLDLEKFVGWQGADMLVHAREQWGGSGTGRSINSVNRITGANQQVNDDADGTRPLHVDQLWFRQHFWERKIAIQIGHLDYQTIVDRNAYASSEDMQFMNAALDNNPLIPTAGQTGLGVAATIKPWDWYQLILGVGDAQRVLYQSGFHTAFHDQCWYTGYMEHGFTVKLPSARGPLVGNYRFGMVYDPVPRAVWVRANEPADLRGGDYGFYTSFDQKLFRESEKDDQGLGWFFRYAYRHDDRVNDSGAGFFSQFWSTGLAYTGLVPTRDKDTLGLAIAQLLPSQQFRDVRRTWLDNETIYEMYYAIPVTPWCVITPDLQYIENPSGGAAVSHAVVGGVRVRVTF